MSQLSPHKIWRLVEIEFVILLAVASLLYFTRLSTPNLRGEETRRGRVAMEMIQTGDWIVPRQQGRLFLSRPPLQNWIIGCVGLARGQVDWLAVRLPSACAMLLAVGLIYGYARGCLSPTGSLVAGLSFATMVQVIELGRLGETEALFTLAVGGSLLVWHWGWSRGWSPYATWSAAYVLVAMGMLLKGPQGPVFFAGPVGLYLIATRRLRDLITWPHACGIAVFALLWNAWQVPYFLAEGLEATRRIYGHDVALRFVDRSWTTLALHVLHYPIDICGCLLPWTPLLLVCCRGRFWNWLGPRRQHALFLMCCLVATFPICWFVPGARGRYYMPLYPCCGVLVGLAAEHCWQTAAQLSWHNAWRQFVASTAVAMAAVGIGVPALGLFPQAAQFAQPWIFAVPFAIASVALAALAWWTAAGLTAAQRRSGAVAVASFVALAYIGLATNIRAQISNDTQRQIAALKEKLPPGAKLVSVGLVDHMFAFYFGELIEPLDNLPDPGPWPGDAEYFCFQPGASKPADFAFGWQEVAVISCDRNTRIAPERVVVVARRVHDRTADAGVNWMGSHTVNR